MNPKPADHVADPLSVTFQALADPTRRGILAQLSTGEKTVTELAEPYQLSLPAISKHLKVLQRAGLIERRRQAQYRPARLEVSPLMDVDQWLDQYRRVWEERFDRLDAYLRRIQDRQAGDEQTGEQGEEDDHGDR